MKRTLAVTSLAALALSACSAQLGDTGRITIGLIAPLTGDAAAIGADTLNGVKMKIDELNASGGIGGRRIDLVAEDGRCNGTDAASAAQKLTSVNKVAGIIGGVCSSETLAAAPIVEAAKTPIIATASSSPDVTDAGSFVYRVYPSDSLKSVAVAKYFKDSGYIKLAMISENTDYSTALRDALVKEIGAENVAFTETVEPGTKDYRTLMDRLKSVDYDAFFSAGQTDSTVSAMVAQYHEAGLTKPFVGGDSADSATVIDLAKEAAEGIAIINVPTSGQGTQFEISFQEKYGAPQSSISWAAHAYDATDVLLQSIAKAGTDGDAVRMALDDVSEHNGVIGLFGFDENGDIQGVSYVLKTVKDGKIIKVKDLPLE